VAAGQIATNTFINVFDGTNWTSLGEITGELTVLYDFAFLGTDLYVGGLFQRAGDVPAAGLAKWDGAKWSDVGGFSGLALNLATDGTNLYVGGFFTNCGGISITNVAKWNGANWSALGGGIGYYAVDLSQAMAWIASLARLKPRPRMSMSAVHSPMPTIPREWATP
jgi:hypothetical protein